MPFIFRVLVLGLSLVFLSGWGPEEDISSHPPCLEETPTEEVWPAQQPIIKQRESYRRFYVETVGGILSFPPKGAWEIKLNDKVIEKGVGLA
jgi:hypothetical protein